MTEWTDPRLRGYLPWPGDPLALTPWGLDQLTWLAGYLSDAPRALRAQEVAADRHDYAGIDGDCVDRLAARGYLEILPPGLVLVGEGLYDLGVADMAKGKVSQAGAESRKAAARKKRADGYPLLRDVGAFALQVACDLFKEGGDGREPPPEALPERPLGYLRWASREQVVALCESLPFAALFLPVNAPDRATERMPKDAKGRPCRVVAAFHHPTLVRVLTALRVDPAKHAVELWDGLGSYSHLPPGRVRPGEFWEYVDRQDSQALARWRERLQMQRRPE